MLLEQDKIIIALRNKMQTQETIESSQTPVVTFKDKAKTVLQINHLQKSTFFASLSIPQLPDMIINSIRAQYGGLSHNYFMYYKSYTKRIDNLICVLDTNPQCLMQREIRNNTLLNLLKLEKTQKLEKTCQLSSLYEP